MAKRRSSQSSLSSSAATSARARRQRSQHDATAPAGAAEHSAAGIATGQESSSASISTAASTSGDSSLSVLPSPGVRGLISLAVIVQGFCLLLAFSSNLAPSYLQGRVLKAAGPYLHLTHQYYHALPLELTRAEPLDFPLLVELQAESALPGAEAAAGAWQSLTLAGLFDSRGAGSKPTDTRWYNLARWLTLIASADAESEILSDFAAQVVLMAERQTGQRYQAVRLVSAKVLSYDEDLMLAGNLRDPLDEAFEPSVIFSARIVRLDAPATADRAGVQGLSLIPAQEALRTAKPVEITEELP